MFKNIIPATPLQGATVSHRRAHRGRDKPVFVASLARMANPLSPSKSRRERRQERSNHHKGSNTIALLNHVPVGLSC